MSAIDGNRDMEAEYGWSDAQFEAALRGRPDAPDALAAFVATAVIELTDPISDDLAKHHIATSAVVARSIAHETAQTAVAARTSGDVAPSVAAAVPTRKRLRRVTFAGAFGGMWAKVALGTAALAAVGTGGAVTDSLPDPMQAIFSNVANVVGVDIPHPGDIDGLDGDGVDDTPLAEPTLEPATSTSLPDDRGVSDEARDQSDEQQEYRACVADAEVRGVEPECDRPTPPGQEDKDTPPGQEDKDTPPGQEDKDTPPGQEDKDTPPGQEDKDTPPGQGGDKPTPPENPGGGNGNDAGGGSDKVKDK
jgi:hypothetical protein